MYKVCEQCNNEFKAKGTKPRFCTKKCFDDSQSDKVFSPIEIEFIKKNYPNSISRKQLAKYFKVTEGCIKRVLRGIDTEKIKPEVYHARLSEANTACTPTVFKKELLSIKKKHGQLNAGFVSVYYNTVYRAGVRYYGNWDKALKGNGYSPEVERVKLPYVEYSKEYIVNKLQELHKDGEELCSRSMNRNNSGLVSACTNYFGSYRKAIEAAGFDYDKVRGWHWGKRKVGKDGFRYASMPEAAVADWLYEYFVGDTPEDGAMPGYARQVRLCSDRMWTCDFVVYNWAGEELWLEVDGLRSARRNASSHKEKINYYETRGFNFFVLEVGCDDSQAEFKKLFREFLQPAQSGANSG